MAPVIDAHAHVFDAADRDARETSELVPAGRSATVEDYEKRLTASGVNHAVLVPLDTSDDYVAAALAQAPDRFRAVAVASPTELGLTGEDPVAALRRRRDHFPFSAVRTMWLGEPQKSLSASPVNPLLTYLEASGLVLWSYLPADQAPFLKEVGERYPGLRVVLNHFGFTPHDLQVDEHGRPWFASGMTPQRLEQVVELAEFPGFHLMFSGQYALSHQPYPYPDLDDMAARLVDSFGPDRTLWGSEWPWIDVEPGYPASLALVNKVLGHLSASEQAAICGGTAHQLMGFDS